MSRINTFPQTESQMRDTFSQLDLFNAETAQALENLLQRLELVFDSMRRIGRAAQDIELGQIVRISDVDEIDLADASDIATSDVAGVALENIVSGQPGKYTTLGVVRKPNWGLVLGTRYFLSDSTPGELTATAPSSQGSVARIIGSPVSTEKLLVNINQGLVL